MNHSRTNDLAMFLACLVVGASLLWLVFGCHEEVRNVQTVNGTWADANDYAGTVDGRVVALVGTPEHEAFIDALKASLTRTQDTQTYPEGYNQDLKLGDVGYLPPIWQDIPNSSVAARFGFTLEELFIV